MTLQRLIAAAALLAAAGCGSDGPPRAVVSGAVSYAGKPVSAGMIRFQIDGRPTALGPIQGGRYHIADDGGVPVGSGRVEIDGFEKTDRVVFVGAGGKKQYDERQTIPAKYNRKSELIARVEAGKANVIDFDLPP